MHKTPRCDAPGGNQTPLHAAAQGLVDDVEHIGPRREVEQHTGQHEHQDLLRVKHGFSKHLSGQRRGLAERMHSP